MPTTINSLVTELQSFITVPRETLTKSLESNITDDNNPNFNELLHDWIVGDYDGDPETLLQELETLLNNEEL